MFVGVVTHGSSPSFDVLLKLDSKQLINFKKTGSYKAAEGVIKTWHAMNVFYFNDFKAPWLFVFNWNKGAKFLRNKSLSVLFEP